MHSNAVVQQFEHYLQQLTWSPQLDTLLMRSIQRYGCTAWSDIICNDLPNWDARELAERCCVLLGLPPNDGNTTIGLQYLRKRYRGWRPLPHALDGRVTDRGGADWDASDYVSDLGCTDSQLRRSFEREAKANSLIDWSDLQCIEQQQQQHIMNDDLECDDHESSMAEDRVLDQDGEDRDCGLVQPSPPPPPPQAALGRTKRKSETTNVDRTDLSKKRQTVRKTRAGGTRGKRKRSGRSRYEVGQVLNLHTVVKSCPSNSMRSLRAMTNMMSNVTETLSLEVHVVRRGLLHEISQVSLRRTTTTMTISCPIIDIEYMGPHLLKITKKPIITITTSDCRYFKQ